MLAYVIARVLGAGLLGVGGWQAGQLLGETSGSSGFLPWGLVGTVVGVVVGGVLTPYVALVPARRILRVSQDISASRIVAGTLGLAIGLIVAVLVSTPLARISGWPGIWIPVTLSVLFASVGALVMLSRERDLLQLLPQSNHPPKVGVRYNGQIVMDTSAIIDGRICRHQPDGVRQWHADHPAVCAGRATSHRRL